MATLYITEQKSVLRKTGDRLLVQKEEEILLDVQCHKIDAVLIFGNVQFTTQAVHELLEHGIELGILTRNGRLIGQLVSPMTKNIELRRIQFRKYEDSSFRLDYSKKLVSAKVSNGIRVVKDFIHNHPEVDLSAEISSLESLLATIGSAGAINALLGMEGTAARTYFACLGKMNLSDLPYEGRRKRPPTDPINALMSLGYTMLFNEISSLLDGLGFDPYLGYFHAADYGRASLAADLMEPFRAPVVDRFTLNLLNLGMFTVADFSENPRGGAINLKRDSLKRYFAEYESHLTRKHPHPGYDQGLSWRDCFRIQSENLKAHLMNEAESFMPFIGLAG